MSAICEPGRFRHVRAIAPYQAGKPIDELAREFGLDPKSIVKLASNENPRGMPESAKRAIAEAMADLGRYPDSNGFALKSALSAKFGVPTDWITLGNGSNDILELAAAALLAPGSQLRLCAAFVRGVCVGNAGARSARDRRARERFRSRPGRDARRSLRHTWSTSPIQTIRPERTCRGRDRDFLARVPSRVVVVIDEAYNEYLPPEHRFDSVQWVRKYPNVLISRTFSKAYGLAGLRVGYGIAQRALTDLLNRVRQPFNVNQLRRRRGRSAE